jgi:ADP-ribosylglycohydrolase
MRISPVALVSRTLDEALTSAREFTVVTHDHPEGIRGACATVHAIFLSRSGVAAADVRGEIARVYGYDMDRSVDDIRPTYRGWTCCQESVPETLICALEGRDFEDALRNAVSSGGDSDTIAAIAGGVAEARFGIPAGILAEAQRRIPGEMHAALSRLYALAAR